MKNLFKTLFFVTFSIFSTLGYAQQKSQINYVIVLDLSDRLLEPNQIKNDKELIWTAFREFHQRIKSELIYVLATNSSFKVVIPTSRNLGINSAEKMNELSITLNDLRTNKNRIIEFEQKLPSKIHALYREVMSGKKSKKEFHGTDIWEFFSYRLKYNLVPNADNRVLVITDGYFDFETEGHVQKQGNLYSSTSFLKTIRSKDLQAIEKLFTSKKIGLIPFQTNGISFQVGVVEIQSKFPDNLKEIEILTQTWKYWLNFSGVKQYRFMPKQTLNDSKLFIQSFL